VTYRFARFLLDGDTRQLFADGTEVHLSPKAFELLRILIQQRARALAKSELQDLLWPSTFVGETNLATLVAEIRRTLEDSAQGSHYVRTVHRFGYRFVAEIREGPPAGAPAAARLCIALGDRRFFLSDGTFVIGRAPDAAIQVDSGGVSRLHAQITVCGRDARVEDLGSKNGTFVGEKKVGEPVPLVDGDVFRVGRVSMTFRAQAADEATRTDGG
jgi:DNA-binding winged helix-turn-helix (wHTH) protein